MVLDITTLRRYVPLAAAGLAFIIASMMVSRFSFSFSVPKDFLPMGTWIMADLSTLYSTLPALMSLTALATSMVTVPDLGLGIRPLGPKIRPRRPTIPIISGVATHT